MSNACKYGEERLDGLLGLLYGDDDQAELDNLRAHVAECEGCRGELEGLTSMKELLSAWPNAVNAPRMVYVNDRVGLMTRVRRWLGGGGAVRRLGGHGATGRLGGSGAIALLRPAIAAALVLVVLVAAATMLDVRVAPNGGVEVGFASFTGAPQAESVDPATTAAAAPVSREELEQSLTRAVEYLEQLFESRRAEDRRLLIAAIDERMQEQGMAMSEELRGAMSAALTDMEDQHEGDLGLVFSAIDELGYVTGSELQRMNTILASLMQQAPEEE